MSMLFLILKYSFMLELCLFYVGCELYIYAGLCTYSYFNNQCEGVVREFLTMRVLWLFLIE